MTLPFGTWPSVSLLSASRPGSPGHWYVDPAAGSDVGTFRGSRNAPLRTIEGLRNRLQSLWTQAPQVVHLRNATYPWTTLRPTLGGAPIVVFGDEVWDPTVANVVATQVAGVGTVNNSVAGAFVADVYRGLSVRFTTGAAVGQAKTVRSNTTTALIPCAAFTPAPAAGDTYEVFNSNAVIAMGGTDVSVRPSQPGVANFGQQRSFADVEGYCFANLRIASVAGRLWYFDQGRYAFYGVEIPPQGAQNTWTMSQALLSAGMERTNGESGTTVAATTPFYHLGAPSITAWRGWGLTGPKPSFAAGRLQGYFVTNDPTAARILLESLIVEIHGGSFRSSGVGIFAVDAAGQVFKTLKLVAADPAVEFSGTTGALVSCSAGWVQLSAGDFVLSGAGPALRATASGTITVLAAVTGQAASGDSVQAVFGGRAYASGAPAFGRAGVDTDWNCGNGVPVNKSFFAAPGVHMPQFTDGSTIIRI